MIEFFIINANRKCANGNFSTFRCDRIVGMGIAFDFVNCFFEMTDVIVGVKSNQI